MSSQMPWPETVTTSGGFVYELPMSAPATVVNDGSVSLQTPRVSDCNGIGEHGTRGGSATETGRALLENVLGTLIGANTNLPSDATNSSSDDPPRIL